MVEVGVPALSRRRTDAGRESDGRAIRARMSALVGDRRKLVVAMMLLATVSAMTEAVILALLAQIAATLVKTDDARVRVGLFHIHGPTKTLILAAFIVAGIRLALQAPLAILPARIVADVWARLRTDLFDAFSSASWEVQSQDREGQLQETMTSQAGQATQGVTNLLSLFASTISFLVLLATALSLNLVAAAIVLAAAVSMFAVLRPLRGLGVRRARALSRAQVSYAAGIAESIRLAAETRVFGVGAAQRARMDALVARSRKLLFETQILSRLGSTVSESLTYLLLVGGLFVLHATGDRHVGSFGAVVLILVRASSSGQSIQSAYQGVIQSIPFVQRLQDTERRYRESASERGAQALEAVSTLAFEGVGFSYRRGRWVLSGLDFVVGAGEVVGVVGPSGAGKSTLVQLLLGLRVPGVGRYLVNGVPVEGFAEGDWHARVAYVPQEPQLLHASVAENIRYFRDFDDVDVRRAARLARIDGDVMGWPDGYETVVGPRADAVSGGQRQRICLARALVGRPQVLVLDEPTSALDPTSERLIGESLAGLKQELTLFIVAHRMSTLDICDRVMIIIDGELQAFDTIQTLQQDSAYYRTATALAAGGTLPA